METLYSYDLKNQKRDLSDVLSTVIAGQPRFISMFPRVPDATNTKHEWLEDRIAGRSITATAVAANVLTVSADDAKKVVVDSRLNVKGDSAVFKVTAVSETSVTVALVAANGSTKTTPAANDVLNIIGTPVPEGSDKGESNYWQSDTNYNYTQIMRGDIILTRTQMNTLTYDGANMLNRQTAFTLQQLARDLNRFAIFGAMQVGSKTTPGTMGGLYAFGTGTGALSVNAKPSDTAFKLDDVIVNDAAQLVMDAGCNPGVVLCTPGQARVLSYALNGKIQIVQGDQARGPYVARVVNAINGNGITIIADPDMPDTDAWVMDPSGFGLSNLSGSAMSDKDSTTPGFDGIRRTAIGELTLEFKNAKQRLCRIYNLMSSAAALAALRA